MFKCLIDCPTEVMWADIMTKLLQGTVFRVMRAELMNCPVNYEDPTEEEAKETKRTQPISALKTVTWKSDAASPFKTPHECVGQDGNCMVHMSTHRVKKHHKNPGIGTHHLKKPGMVRQMPESPESPYVQRRSTGTTRVASTNLRWRREHARGKE